MSDADIDFNEFITDRSKGMVLFHDHFVGRAGGFAIFYVDSERELESLQDKKQLKNWEFQIFHLTFTELPIEFCIKSTLLWECIAEKGWEIYIHYTREANMQRMSILIWEPRQERAIKPYSAVKLETAPSKLSARARTFPRPGSRNSVWYLGASFAAFVLRAL